MNAARAYLPHWSGRDSQNHSFFAAALCILLISKKGQKEESTQKDKRRMVPVSDHSHARIYGKSLLPK